VRSVLNVAYRVGREAVKGIAPGAGLLVEGVGFAAELPNGMNAEKVVTLSELKQPSYFEDKQIISTIGDLIIANYDFRKSLAEWR
jgi:hypothetical protein